MTTDLVITGAGPGSNTSISSTLWNSFVRFGFPFFCFALLVLFMSKASLWEKVQAIAVDVNVDDDGIIVKRGGRALYRSPWSNVRGLGRLSWWPNPGFGFVF